MITLTAHRFIHVFTTYHLSDVLGCRADVERRCEVASLANGLELFDLLALGHQLNYGLKHCAHTSSIQSGHNHDLPLVCCILTPNSHLIQDYLSIITYVLKELALIDANDIIEFPFFADVGQLGRTYGL